MLRRRMLKGLSAAPFAAQKAAAEAAKIAGNSGGDMGAKLPLAPVPTTLGPVQRIAHKEMLRIERSMRKRHAHRHMVPAPDIAELVSISPAAKRFIAARREDEETAVERRLLNPLRKALGWLSPSEEDYE